MIEPELLKDVLVQVGSAFEVITNIARDYEVDLIVLTTHGKIGLKHVFGGALPNASCGTRLARSWSCGRTSKSSFRINRVAARAKVTAQSGEKQIFASSTPLAFCQQLQGLLNGTGIDGERQRKPLTTCCRETFDYHSDDLRFPVLGEPKDGPAAVSRIDISINQETAQSEETLVEGSNIARAEDWKHPQGCALPLRKSDEGDLLARPRIFTTSRFFSSRRVKRSGTCMPTGNRTLKAATSNRGCLT